MTTRRSRPWVSFLAVLFVSVVFTLTAGSRGLVLGGLVAACWWVLSPMYAFVFGQFALLVVLADTSRLASVAGAELGLITLLLTATAGLPRSGRVLLLSLCAVASVSGLAWLGLQRVATVWSGGGLVLGGGAMLAYWIHRYEREVLDPPRETPGNHE